MKKFLEVKPKKIAIFRALQLGDLLCAIPSVRALKAALPDSEITLIGLPWASTFVKRFENYFAQHISFPGYPGLPEQEYHPGKFMEFLKRALHEEFDMIIQLQGNGSIVNPLIELLGAKNTAGYYKSSGFCPDKNTFMRYPEGYPEIDRHLMLMEFLGIPWKGKHLEFPLSEQEEGSFLLLSQKHDLKTNEYVCIHPGARDMERWWSLEKFARVGDAIAERGFKIVLTGTLMEKCNVDKVESLMGHSAINCAGKTDLGTLGALIKNARMVFSNDTGISHIAAAMKTPSMIIFLKSDPVRWAPLNKDLHQIILPQQSGDIKYVLRKTANMLSEEKFSGKANKMEKVEKLGL